MKATGYLFCDVAYGPIQRGETYRVIGENGANWRSFAAALFAGFTKFPGVLLAGSNRRISSGKRECPCLI